jgi:hypothetical protein
MRGNEPFPGVLVALLEGQSLAVGTVAQNCRIAAFCNGTKDIGSQYQTIVGRNRCVPMDLHAIAQLGFLCDAHFFFIPAASTISGVHVVKAEWIIRPNSSGVEGAARTP